MKKNGPTKKPAKRTYRTVFLILCAAFFACFPFICRLCLNKIPDDEAEIYASTNGYITDLFCYSKEIALLIFAGAVLLYLIGEHIFPDNIEHFDKNRLSRLRFPIICACGYGLLTVISFIFSEHKATALLGVNSEYEGMPAILAYMIIFLAGLYFFKPSPEKHSPLSILRTAIMILCLIAGLLSVIEVFYKPILEFTFIQDLISSEKTRELAHSIRCENFIGQISLFFNNPGYLGGFCALFIPILLSLSIEYTQPENNAKHKKTARILCIADIGLLGLSIVWSRSTVAILSLFVSIPMLFIVYFVNLRKSSCRSTELHTALSYFGKTVIINTAAAFLIAAIAVILSNVLPNSVSYKHQNGLDTTISEFAQYTVEDADTAEKPLYKLTEATLDNGVLSLRSGETLLRISMKPNALYELLSDDDNSDLSKYLTFSDGVREIKIKERTKLYHTYLQREFDAVTLDDPRFNAITVGFEDEALALDLGYNGTVEFYMTEQGIKLFGQGSTLLNEIPQPGINASEKLYRFATGRGYTWIQSLPILKECLLTGKGNGNFGFYFTQNEIVGLLNTHGSCKYVIDRPHNWYLQIAVSSGIPAMLLVLALFVFYFIRFLSGTVFTVTKNAQKTERVPAFLIGLFSGLIAFMFCGLINDSYITVNPLFWMLLAPAVANLPYLSRQ